MQQDQISKIKRSWIMSRVRSKNTKAELALRKELWKRGLRYRVNYSGMVGKPDIVFLRAKVIIFIDGAFWHGKKLSEDRLSKMSTYWQDKIRNNRLRDESINLHLGTLGYTILRLDEQEVLKYTKLFAIKIEKTVKNRKS
jgi:DNA mismatch endonuclease (patch repair protein)